MAFFTRTSNPPIYKNHRSYKRFLRFDFNSQCAYCEITEGYLRGSDAFGADHFRPFAHFPELDCVYGNLYYCCNECNSYKGASWPTKGQEQQGSVFIDPCLEDPYTVHYSTREDGTLATLSLVGEYSLLMLRLNREKCRRFRFRRMNALKRIDRFRVTLSTVTEASPLRDAFLQALDDAESEWADTYAQPPSGASDGTNSNAAAPSM